MQLNETLRRTEGELNGKDRLIEKYQLEIRQRNDEIEKKVTTNKSGFGVSINAYKYECIYGHYIYTACTLELGVPACFRYEVLL